MAKPPAGAAFLGGLAIGIVILAGSGFEEARAASVDRSDFAVVWIGSRTLLEGGDPYSDSSFQATAARYGTTRATIPIETYPPWVTIALVPLGLLDLSTAAALWAFGGVVLAALALHALMRSAVSELPVLHTLAGLALVASQPAIATFAGGQWTFFLVAALSALVLALRTGHSRLAVLATLPLLAKPQLFPFALWALGFATLGRRPRQTAFVVGGVATWLTVILGSVLVLPQWTFTWVTRVAIGVALDDRTAPTIAHWPTAVFGAWGVLATVIILGAGLAAGRSADPRSDTGLAVWLGLSLLLATYIRSYDQLLFIVPLALAAGGVGAISQRHAIGTGLGGFGLLLIGSTVLYGTAAADRQNEDVTLVLAVAIFLVLVIAHRTTQSLGRGRSSRGRGGVSP